MTITKLHEVNGGGTVAFRTMDSLSPVFVDHILNSSDPARTLYIIASKSGSTIEPLMLERVVWQYVSARLDERVAAGRFVAITDSGSTLERLAHDRGYRLILTSPRDVGGRFSALTVFALFPAALVGIDIDEVIVSALKTERMCTSDSPDNPALGLACFLYDSYRRGRDKFSLILPPSGQVFGLWIEQMVAESLGKEGRGILPNVEVDASILTVPRADRSVITYAVGSCEGFEESTANIDATIPVLNFAVDTPYEAFSRFVIWEYAIAFLGILMGTFPFDQPDVEITKQLVKGLLSKADTSVSRGAVAGDGAACGDAPDGACGEVAGGDQRGAPDGDQRGVVVSDGEGRCLELPFNNGFIETLRVSPVVADAIDPRGADGLTVDHALRALLGSLKSGDYFSLNAFLPFRGYGRREALERMRNRVASRLGVVSCLEIGPRYLHSTGQLHKGGPNNGVFLILSADEDDDIVIPHEDFTLGTLAAIQAQGDFAALASRGRRVIQIHLNSNDAEILSHFADRFCSAISAIRRP
jgi:glucose-6-phosphate isomerase